MAPKRPPKSPIPQPKRPGLPARPDATKAEPPKQQLPAQHKPWSTSVKGGQRGR
ncbi:MAG TPA: hypothetical protein VMT93_08630 [Gemmatimonadaceae bacterium]|nr:hypothetical protein [Gemmatimonadaceae bacterium]